MTDHTRLHDLYREQGQSPWLDNLRRGWITGGELQQWVDDGVRGITSNPSIFQKAIEKSDDYDDEFGSSISAGASVEDAYWTLVTSDIRSASEHPAPGPRRERRPRRLRLGGGRSVAGPRHRRHHRERPDVARDHRRTKPVREDPRHGRGPARDPADDLGGPQHQRHPAVRPRALRRGDRGLPRRARGVRGRPVRRVVGGVVLREPGRHRGGPPARGHRHRRGPRPAGQGRGRQRAARLPAVPRALPGRALGGAGGPGRTGAAAAVGVDVDQEPGLPRHALRRHPHRAGHGEHDARGHPRGVRWTTAPWPARSTPTSTARGG